MNTKVLWFTGLSGSGKTTIANKLKERLEDNGKTIKIIDGDDIRNTLHKHLGFSPEDIKENNRLISEICKNNLGKFDYIFVPVISPFKESRKLARKKLGKNFIEVYVKCDVNECIKRDTKGLYKKALSGEIKNFIGIAKEVLYEPPDTPELILSTSEETTEESISKIIIYLDSSKKNINF